jgi:hypothetical protein
MDSVLPRFVMVVVSLACGKGSVKLLADDAVRSLLAASQQSVLE